MSNAAPLRTLEFRLAETASRGSRECARVVLAVAVLAAWTVWAHLPLLRCLDRCYADTAALHPSIGAVEVLDTQLNVWILAAVQRNLISRPLQIFEANAFHPAPAALAGSELLLGLAVAALPLRLVTADAIWIHQLTLIATAFAGALATFVLARWLVGSTWAAFAAGWIALFLPWRLMELSHLQLLAACAFPLIWWAMLRLLLDVSQRGAAWWLSIGLAFSMLSSFYLSYQLFVSLAVLAMVIAVLERPPLRAWIRVALATGPPALLLAALSIPFLARSTSGDLGATLDSRIATDLADVPRVWRLIAPSWEFAWRRSEAVPLTYTIPGVVAVLAGVGALSCIWPLRPTTRASRRQLSVAAALVAIGGAGFLFMLGYRLRVGAITIPLPGAFAADWLPGFSNIRAPHRFGILLMMAVPPVAVLGASAIERTFAANGVAGASLKWGARILVASLLLANVPWRQIPARPAWEHGRRPPVYEVLDGLPAGPVVEVPWTSARRQLFTPYGMEAAAMVASTRQWWPLLNGYTGYVPASYHFLRRVGGRLPEPRAVEQLRRAAGLRWIVVHLDRLLADERAAWDERAHFAGLRLAYEDEKSRVYEVPLQSDTADWIGAMRATEPRPATLYGVSRAPLELPSPAGSLEVSLLDPLRYFGRSATPARLQIRIHNASAALWPGFDLQREGLVELRAAFADAAGRIETTERIPIDVDLSPGATTSMLAMLDPPTRRGRYRICFDLVQRLLQNDRPLPVPPVELKTVVQGIDEKPNGWMLLRASPAAEQVWACGDGESQSRDPNREHAPW